MEEKKRQRALFARLDLQRERRGGNYVLDVLSDLGRVRPSFANGTGRVSLFFLCHPVTSLPSSGLVFVPSGLVLSSSRAAKARGL